MYKGEKYTLNKPLLDVYTASITTFKFKRGLWSL